MAKQIKNKVQSTIQILKTKHIVDDATTGRLIRIITDNQLSVDEITEHIKKVKK